MPNFNEINRLMKTGAERLRQDPGGTRLERFMSHVDPYDEDREESQMDMFEREAPVVIEIDDEGNVVNEATGQTARTPKGEEDHSLNATIVSTELVWE